MQVPPIEGAPNGWAFSGEPSERSERSERPERMRGRRVRCNAMLGGSVVFMNPSALSNFRLEFVGQVASDQLSLRYTLSEEAYPTKATASPTYLQNERRSRLDLRL